ncbi:MAG: hypothetical protein K2P99_01140 [Burkholderiales bacterium]|nr:hypothetical protein [Burkholderiales bacterium]
MEKNQLKRRNLIDISAEAVRYGFSGSVFITKDVDAIIQNSNDYLANHNEANLRQILYSLKFRILNHQEKLKYVYFSAEFIVNKKSQQVKFFVILDAIHLNNTAIIINMLSSKE